jgi:hypothetical protein
LPTLAIAIIDAPRPLGVNHLDLPHTPFRIWHALNDSKTDDFSK